MAQDLERFEQGRPQRPILPSRLFDNHLEQPAVLGGWLLKEQLARPARQAQHVDGLIDWGRRGLLDILDLALQPILLGSPSCRLLVKKLLGDSTVELVHVHRLDARLDLVVPGLQLIWLS